MEKYYKNDVINFEEGNIEDSESLFEHILESRKGGIDSKRFFLDYISPEEIAKYDFNDVESLKAFRERCVYGNSPLILMGGCNLNEEHVKNGLRYSGIKLSDPEGKIMGTFDRHGEILTYSPIFQAFYDERDLCKFAREHYFTTLTFEELLMREFDLAREFYVHIGSYSTAKEIGKYGSYKMEKITKDEMVEFARDPEKGESVRRKYLKY